MKQTMNVYMGMSSTMYSYLRGNLSDEELLHDDTLLVFACEPSHAFQEEGWAPIEATWVNGVLPHSSSDLTKVPVDSLPEETRDLYGKWVDIINQLRDRRQVVFQPKLGGM
jgi:hypothetical protein